MAQISHSRLSLAALALLSAATLPALAVLGAGSSSAATAVSSAAGPALVTPRNGAKLREGRTPLLSVRSSGKGQVWVHVSKSKKRDSAGVLKTDASIGRAKPKGGVYTYKPKYFDFPAFWANTPGRYYWQAHRIACGEEPKASDCRVESTIRSFVIR